MAEVHTILVVGEVEAGHLTTATTEVLAAARMLAQQGGQRVAAALLGNHQETAAQAIRAGADQVYLVEHALLDRVQPDLYVTALQALCQTVSPQILLLARSELGRELAPRLACRLGVSVLQDCLELALDADSGCLIGTRPVYGGNVLARICCTATPQVATVRPKIYTALPPDPGRTGEVVSFPVTLEPDMVRSTVLREEVAAGDGVKLEDARVVVAGGRGLGGPEPFRELQELAGILGAGIGASRAAVDAGWVPGNWQIGLTGKTIAPEVYITVGISGASQHMAGCANAKVIVAINTDREADIFRAARYGLIGEWQVVLPALMQAIRELT